jgi:hypothetical protein
MVANFLNAKMNLSCRLKKGWSKPPMDFVKLTTDAVVNLETRKGFNGFYHT